MENNAFDNVFNLVITREKSPTKHLQNEGLRQSTLHNIFAANEKDQLNWDGPTGWLKFLRQLRPGDSC